MKRQLVLGKMLENHRSDKELMSKTCEVLKHPSSKKISKKLILKMGKGLE